MVAPILEPGTPDWFKRYNLRANASYLPVTPTKPGKLFPVATADLPPAADFAFCLAFDTTLNRPTFSDGTTWTAL